ncbi:MAG TPA: leucyl aminopeptidase [Chloroflexota bacterium]|nr:leucyl aminopeptidase [Chloroflexota bacterium]HZU05213.1 leucyl aminopeptidase [Chloroflexota bacterium]
MELVVEQGSLVDIATPLLVVNLFEDAPALGGATAAVDEALGGLLGRLRAAGELRGKLGEAVVVHNPDGQRLRAERVVVVGLGPRTTFGAEAVRRAAAVAARKAQELRVSEYATIVHGAGAGGLAPAVAAEALAEGTLLALYRYDQFKSRQDEEAVTVRRATVVERDPERLAAVRAGVQSGTALAEATMTARDLAQGPANLVTPAYLAEQARAVAQRYGIACEVYGLDEIREMRMGGLLAVNQGSANPARFVVMRYRGPQATKTLAVVGKGITFDSGGISIKPAENMHHMRHDKAGAAAVVGFMQAAATLQLPINALGIFAATENMPSGSAYRPGDVIRARNGTTMEIINTDAEGRVILSDALTYAAEQQPDAIVDLATLTGACVVALGHHASGLFGNDEGLIELMRRAGEASGERVWPLPLWPEYREQIKSTIADIKNIGGRPAGAITAAWFLAHFVDGRPWLHLDIAGTAWTESSWGELPPYLAKDAATGVGVRLLVHFVRLWNGR